LRSSPWLDSARAELVGGPTTVSIISFIWALSVVVVTGTPGRSPGPTLLCRLGAFIAAKSAWCGICRSGSVLVGGLVAMVIALALERRHFVYAG